MDYYYYLVPFLVIGVGSGFLVTIVLFIHKRGNRLSNKILGSLLLIITFSLSEALLVLMGGYKLLPHFVSTSLPLTYLIGPLFYFHIYTKFENDKTRLNMWSWIHIVPLLIVFADKLPFYMNSGEAKIEIIDAVFNNDALAISFRFGVFMLFRVIQNGTYIFFAWKLIKKNETTLKNIDSNSSIINIEWLKSFTLWFAGYWIIYFAVFFVLALSGSFSIFIDSLIFFGQSIFVISIGFKVLQEPELYTTPILVERIGQKYERSSLSKEMISHYVNSLKRIMEKEKPYLKSDLSLSELANSLSMSTHHLSQVLNQEMELSFFDYINGYRVEEAKKKLVHPEYQNLTILAIAHEVGFNNKASFNRIFKKYVGRPPSQFIKLNTYKDKLSSTKNL